MKKIIKYLNETIKKEKALLIFTFIIFILGLTIGSLFINFITKDDKTLLINQVEVFFSSIKKMSSDVFGTKYFIIFFMFFSLINYIKFFLYLLL